MSHLELPRLHFRGDFHANVATANNDDIAVAFPDQQFVDVAQVRVDTLGKDDDEFIAWVRQIAPPFGIRGGWNLYGDCYCGLRNTMVRSGRPSSGQLLTTAAEESFIGASIMLPKGAVMVDADPEGTLGTQIFCDEIQFVGRDGKRIGGQPSRFYSRDISRRNLTAGGFTAFGASWFAAIRPDEMSIEAGDSPTLQAFQDARKTGSGLFVAFCCYLMAPAIPQQQLAQDFANGIPTQNPAVGRVVGSLGAWRPGELQSAPVGRRLVPGASLRHNHLSYSLNPALAHVDDSRYVVSLDLSSTFPEVDETLEKVNAGEVRLGVRTTGGCGPELHDLGEVSYSRFHYEREGGIQEVPFDPKLAAHLSNGDLVLYQAGSTAVLLAESNHTILSDDRCLYLHPGDSVDVNVRLHVRGREPVDDTTVFLRQYSTSDRTFAVVPPADPIVEIASEVVVPAGGAACVSMVAKNAGTCEIAFLGPGDDPDSLTWFACVRVLPDDDYDSIPAADLTFEFVYAEVLRYYHLLFPAMSELIDLSSEFDVGLVAQFIRDRIDPAEWDNVEYMPITRDLSDGKRRLLDRWCKQVLGIPDTL